jgi:hypothetical protein
LSLAKNCRKTNAFLSLAKNYRKTNAFLSLANYILLIYSHKEELPI